MINKLLYLTYIPLDKAPKTGSSVRPLKMKAAFESLDIDLRTIGGISNDLLIRAKAVAEIRRVIRTWRPDACYIEPPAGPLFYAGDVEVIKYLHRKGIPVSLFYRDAYWKYPEYSEEGKLSAKTKIKKFIIKQMQLHQWRVFRKNVDLIYFPSETMSENFDCPAKDTLPPGTFVPAAKKKEDLSVPLQFIFVGGAARNHGTHLTIEAFARLNSSGTLAKLFYICPKDQWDSLGIDGEQYGEWLEVIHTSGDENLIPYYEKADIAILTAPRTFYRDFAVPVKLFEYISFLKPILVTDCTETAKIVRDNAVGWVAKDDAESVLRELRDICGKPEKILAVREGLEKARDENLWSRRAQKVVHDLDLIKSGS